MKSALHVPGDLKTLWGQAIEEVKGNEKFKESASISPESVGPVTSGKNRSSTFPQPSFDRQIEICSGLKPAQQ